MNLKEILKGCSIAYNGIQSINGLTIVPLTCERKFSLDNSYASPYAHKASVVGTYGNVVLHKNAGETKEVLVYPNSGYITSSPAQDHLISKAALLKKSSVTLSDSRCIQSSQAGYLSTSMPQRTVIAPMHVREIAMNFIGQEGYGNLWEPIKAFNRDLNAANARGEANLKDYFQKWDKDLDQFIAHFEKLDNCIGFITLYNDEVVAVDKFPSFSYCSEIWSQLVRDSYASLVIHDKLKGIPAKGKLKTAKDLSGTLEQIYENLVKSRTEHYKELLSEIVDVEFETKKDKDTPGSNILKAEGYIGQVIDDNGINVMVSIIKKKSFDPEKLRSARKLRKIAKDQKEFEI